MNRYRVLFSVLVGGVTLALATEIVVKKSKVSKRLESVSVIREECCELLADIVEVGNLCARAALNLQAQALHLVRSWLAAEEGCCVATASKESLKLLREKLQHIKQRSCALELELEQFRQELTLLAAKSS